MATTTSATIENYVYPYLDRRNYLELPEDYAGYAPKVGELVHIREVSSHGYFSFIRRGVYPELVQGEMTMVPKPFEVVKIIPGDDVEVFGRTVHVPTEYVCQDTTLSFRYETRVPARRLVKADPPAANATAK